MSKAYVVCKVGFEYNDEVYYRPDSSEGLDPKSVFLNADEANALCLQKNLEWFKSQEADTWNRGLNAYTDDGLDGICDYRRSASQKIRDLFSKYDAQVFSETWEDGDDVEDEQILENFYSYLVLMPKEEQLEVISLLRVFGWTVKEVDLVQ